MTVQTLDVAIEGHSARFLQWAASMRPQVEQALAVEFEPYADHAVALHSPLVAAMRHGVMNGGKRVRALAALASAQLVGGEHSVAMQIAVALEYIHAYSLIHDDLPCMDDDDLRRGQPTVHVVYGEAQALLAGDALQTLAFDILTQAWLTDWMGAGKQVELMRTLAQASGMIGMAGGQAIDCHHVGQVMAVETMQTMHRLKTGALLRASVMMGALCGKNTLSAEQTECLSRFAEDLGLLFQVVDDILDASQDTATLGKTAGKDADANKPTYVQAMGIDGARGYAQQLYADALMHLNQLCIAPEHTQGVQCLADLTAYCHERLF